jgi:hypothetical protein
MNIELLGQFGQRFLTPHGSQSHLRLECRRMVPAGSFAHRLSCSAAILAAVRQKRHLSNPFKNPEPALGQEEQVIWTFQSVEQIAFHLGDPHVQRRLGPEELYVTLLVPADISHASK